MRLGLGLGIVKSAASIYKGILDKFPNAVAAYSTRKLKTSYPTTLPADYGGGAAAAYSLRKVKSDYEGSAVKVRRSSDGGLQDIGFDSNGNLDTTALLAFVNADVNQYTSDYSVGTDGMFVDNATLSANESVGGLDDALKVTSHVGSGQIYTRRSGAFSNLNGNTYRLQAKVYLPSTNAQVDGVRVWSGFGSETFADVSTTDSWVSINQTISITQGTSLFFSAKDGALINFTTTEANVFYIKDVIVTQTTADGHVTRWYSQSDPVDTYTSNFDSTATPVLSTDGFSATPNNTATVLSSVTDIHGTTVDNVLELNCDDTTSTIHILRKNNPLPTTGSIANLTLKCSFKMLVPSSNTTLVGAALSDGTQTTAGIVSGGKVTEQGRWTTFTDVAWTQINQSRLFFMGLDASDNVTFSATAGDKFYIADVVLTQTTDAYNATSTEQPLIVEGGDVVLENGKAAIEFDGADCRLNFSNVLNLDSYSNIYVGNPYSPSSGLVALFGSATKSNLWLSTSPNNYPAQRASDNSWVYWNGSGNSVLTDYVSEIYSKQVLINFISDSTNIHLYLNSTDKGYNTPTDTGIIISNIFQGYGSQTYAGVHRAQEIIFFDSDQSANRKDIEWNINNHYSIYDQWDRESCMNVRRSSDNATQDIGFSGKNINQTQLESFVNDASPVLDDYTGDDAAEAAYSLRKIRTAYTGSAINVRRSSDGDSKDIGFDANGDLDTTALTTFVNEDVDVYTSDFSSTEDLGEFNVTGAAAQSVGGVNDAYKFTLSGGNVQHTAFGPANTLESGKSFTIVFDYYIPSGQTLSSIVFDNFGGSGAISGSLNVTDNWTTETINFTADGSRPRWWAGAFATNVNGDGDVFYLKNIVVTQTTADGAVTTWYDQSGSNNATNSSDSEQPLIVEAGDVVLENGKPAIKFDGVDDNFTANALAGLSRLDLFFATQTSDTIYVHFSNTFAYKSFTAHNGSVDSGLPSNMGTPTMYNNGTQFTGTTRDDVHTAQNGHQIISYTDATTSTWTGFKIGGEGSFVFKGKFQELIAFDSDQSTNRLSIEGNIGRYYNITGYRDGFVTKWYDQSGEYNHAENSTHDDQPQIVSNGSMLEENGKAAIDFDGASHSFSVSKITLSDDWNLFLTHRLDSTSYYFGDTLGGDLLRYRINDSYRLTISGVSSTVTGIGDINDVQKLLNIERDSSNNLAYYLNSSSVATSSISGAWDIDEIGASSTNHFNGVMQELIIFNSDQSSNRTDIEKNINTHFKIYS